MELAVHCAEGHPRIALHPELSPNGDGRRSYQCPQCHLSLAIKPDRWARIQLPIAAAGMDDAPLRLLVMANSR